MSVAEEIGDGAGDARGAADIVEHVAPEAMPERTWCDHPEMLRGHLTRPIVGGECTCPTEQCEFPTHPIGADRRTELRRRAEHRIRDR